MENAVDALKMVAAILIFVIAIASSFSLFGTAKTTADSIMTMRDKQAYLEAAELDGEILYTSSSTIKEGLDATETNKAEESNTITGVTKKGDRIVKLEDVISTIYRYSKEKYGVTIVESDGDVIARFDSNTEQIMSMWYDIDKTKEGFIEYIERLNVNTETEYAEPDFDASALENIYKIEVPGSSITHGAPWYGNEEEIQKRIACDLNGSEYKKEYKNALGDITAEQKYQGKNLINILTSGNPTIIEVTNEIDNSKYLEDGDDKTDLVQEYVMPTLEIVYIIT